MKKDKICISNLLDLANEYNLAQDRINGKEEDQKILDKLEKRQKTLQREIFSTIRSHEKEDRSKIICKINWLIRDTENKIEDNEESKFSALTLTANAQTVIDSYFTCFAQAKIANAMQIFSTNTNDQLGIAFCNIKEDVKGSALVENLFVRHYLEDIKNKSVEKSENSKDADTLKKCTQVIACESILQDFIDQEIERTTSKDYMDKNCEAQQ